MTGIQDEKMETNWYPWSSTEDELNTQTSPDKESSIQNKDFSSEFWSPTLWIKSIVKRWKYVFEIRVEVNILNYNFMLSNYTN